MALIKFKVVTAGPGAPKVVSDDVINLHAADRLLFEADNGLDVLVNLGDSLVGLVKFTGGDATSFSVQVLPPPDGRAVVTLVLPGGGGQPTDPPNTT